MVVRWTEHAASRLNEIKEHIATDNPRAALKQVRLIFAATRQLSSFPNAGKAGRVEGTRELAVPNTPYIIPYRIVHDTIHIEHRARRSRLAQALLK
jgi:toxin ParE1/3/4